MAQLAFENLAWGSVAGLAGLILLLLLGTQVLHWYWPALLLLLTAAVGWYRGRKRVPGDYRTILRVDHAMDAHDVVATAWHFSTARPAPSPNPAFLSEIERQAASLASGADVRALLPLRRPAAAWAALLLLAAAGGTFGLRYGMLRTIDLRAPIAEVRFDTFTGAPVNAAEKRARGKKPGLPEPFGLSVAGDEQFDLAEPGLEREEALKSLEVASNEAARPGQGKDGRRSETSESGQQGESDGDDEGTESGDAESPSGAQDPRRASDEKSAPRQPQDNEEGGLMDKMRDALANLLDKLKMEPQSADSQQLAANQKGGPQSGQTRKQPGDRGAPAPSKQDASGEPGDESDQPGDGQQAQQARAQADQGVDTASKQERSGIGKQDGSKDTELAEHAEAMGKLSEILGKRSQTLQGEVMVEVTNSRNQQVRTPYLERGTTAPAQGGELSRDEVPLHLQHYVQQYYEQVRKPAPPALKP